MILNLRFRYFFRERLGFMLKNGAASTHRFRPSLKNNDMKKNYTRHIYPPPCNPSKYAFADFA